MGVGHGLLYQHFAALGWTVSGVEPGDWGAGFPGVVRSIDAIDACSAFDLIVAMDVLEHVQDPIGMVSRMHRMAAPGARLFMAFPNRDSLRGRWGKGQWRMVRPFGHLHFFSKASARRMLQSAGLTVQTIRTTDLMSWTDVAGPRSTLLYLGQFVGLGDQLVIEAKTSPTSL